jgi:hypothetical protein
MVSVMGVVKVLVGQSDHYEVDNYVVLMTTMKVTTVCGLHWDSVTLHYFV